MNSLQRAACALKKFSYALFWLAKMNASCCQTKYANTHKQIILLILHVHELPSQCSLSGFRWGEWCFRPTFCLSRTGPPSPTAQSMTLRDPMTWFKLVCILPRNLGPGYNVLDTQFDGRCMPYSQWGEKNGVILQPSLVTSPSSGMSGVISLWLKSDPQGSILSGKIAIVLSHSLQRNCSLDRSL